MRFLFNAVCVIASIEVLYLLMLAYEYSFGSGFGLHPGVVGAAIVVIGLAVHSADVALESQGH